VQQGYFSFQLVLTRLLLVILSRGYFCRRAERRRDAVTHLRIHPSLPTPAACPAVEVDGPVHFAANTRHLTGATALKRRLLQVRWVAGGAPW
jgi:hypothetical protein